MCTRHKKPQQFTPRSVMTGWFSAIVPVGILWNDWPSLRSNFPLHAIPFNLHLLILLPFWYFRAFQLKWRKNTHNKFSHHSIRMLSLHFYFVVCNFFLSICQRASEMAQLKWLFTTILCTRYVAAVSIFIIFFLSLSTMLLLFLMVREIFTLHILAM